MKKYTGLMGTILVLLIVAYFLYVGMGQLDYTWQWSRVMNFVINRQPEFLYAPEDGQVVQQAEQLILQTDFGNQVPIVGENILVYPGDFVFVGDALSSVANIQPGILLKGLWTTVHISFFSLIMAIILGIILAFARISHFATFRHLSIIYIELIRGTPLLVQIFITYFFVGNILNLQAYTAGVIALSVFTSAYVAEIIRSGIESVPKGQMEAARSLGLSYFQAMRYVILPQGFKNCLPSLAGQLINLIKDSSLVSVIAITDLTKGGREVIGSTFATFETWLLVGLLYFVLTGILSIFVHYLERRLQS